MMKNILKKSILLVIVVCIIVTFVSFADSEDKKEMYGSKKLDDFNGKVIGNIMGSINDLIVKKVLPNVEIKSFNSVTDMLANIKSKKVDAGTVEFATYCELYRNDSNYKILEEPLGYVPQSYMLSKKICEENNGKVLKEINEFIEENKNNGWLEQVENKWILNESSSIEYENKKLNNYDKTLVVTFSPYVPYAFIKGENPAGMDVEIIETFAEKYKYNIQYENVDFLSGLAGIGSGKYDVAIGGITITEERKKSVNFCDSYYNDKIMMLYYENSKNNKSIITNIKESFEKSFIIEERYKIVIAGIINTIIITMFSILGGIIVGFLLYMLYRKNVIVTNKIIDLYAYIMNGLPFLVLLLVLYYVVFATVNVSGIIVSIIAFVMTFGLYIFSSMSSFVDMTDKGQKEAACALGYTNSETFKKILLPQVVLQMYPGFKSQVISLLKDTSIVGYIAVVDLTRAGDLIRSRTYEAFFPIISVAIIYFILGIFFKIILTLIGNKLNPKNRKIEDILKGVTYDKN